MATFSKSYAGKRVFVTGHTGFKGSWLCEWLLGLGSEVWGFSLPPATKPALFQQLGLAKRINHIEGDLRNAAAVSKAVAASSPHYVFHLAAQPIVRAAHAIPEETWATNVMGTIHLLEALRDLRHPCAAVIVTTDKVYAGSQLAHTEKDPLGADDPYAASKAAVELAVEAWRHSYFTTRGAGRRKFPLVALATARSGNVIGGGDWAKDRLLPDCVRALSRGVPISVRNPSAVRPWQHVLDPLEGYLRLAAELRRALKSRNSAQLSKLSGPFNFGPVSSDQLPVRKLVRDVLNHWPGKWHSLLRPDDPKEATVLRLNSRKAQLALGWRPRWRFASAVEHTVSWYREATSPAKALRITQRQIAAYAGE